VARLRSFDRMSTTIYHYMAGPSEFRIIGTLRDWDIMDRLGEIDVPAMITCGEYDECRPVHTREVAERIPGARLEIIPDGSHLCFVERSDIYMPMLREFLAGAEA
jgi:proline-specific peptidase